MITVPLMFLAPHDTAHYAMVCPMDNVEAHLYSSALFGSNNNAGLAVPPLPPDPSKLTDSLPPDTSSENILCTITNKKNLNLTASQLELLSLHWRFNHLGMHDLQKLIHPSCPLTTLRVMLPILSPALSASVNLRHTPVMFNFVLPAS
eukprot:7810024-Ditylum_brightwellii.AAC.2